MRPGACQAERYISTHLLEERYQPSLYRKLDHVPWRDLALFLRYSIYGIVNGNVSWCSLYCFVDLLAFLSCKLMGAPLLSLFEKSGNRTYAYAACADDSDQEFGW